MLIGVLFAMGEEAEPFVIRYNLKLKEVYRSQEVYLGEIQKNKVITIVSGIGSVNAMLACSRLISMGVDVIVNIGTCGARLGKNSVGRVIIPGEFYDGEFDLSAFGVEGKDPYGLNCKDYKGIKCYSFSHFVTEKIEDGEYIVDMEGYGIACMCDFYGIRFFPIKVVSDSSDKNAQEEFDKNLKSVMNGVFETFEKIIGSLSGTGLGVCN